MLKTSLRLNNQFSFVVFFTKKTIFQPLYRPSMVAFFFCFFVFLLFISFQQFNCGDTWTCDYRPKKDSATGEHPPTTLKVFSFNLERGLRPASLRLPLTFVQGYKLDEIIDYLRGKNADILLLQVSERNNFLICWRFEKGIGHGLSANQRIEYH